MTLGILLTDSMQLVPDCRQLPVSAVIVFLSKGQTSQTTPVDRGKL